MRRGQATALGDSQIGDSPVASSSKDGTTTAVPSGSSIPLLPRVGEDIANLKLRRFADHWLKATTGRRPHPAMKRRLPSRPASFITSRRCSALRCFSLWRGLPAAYSQPLSDSLVLQLLSAGGPIAIFCAMQYWRHANESMKNRIRALEQERADANKADRLSQLAAKARADLATIDEAVGKATERSLALSNTVTAEPKAGRRCRESEGLLAG